MKKREKLGKKRKMRRKHEAANFNKYLYHYSILIHIFIVKEYIYYICMHSYMLYEIFEY